MIYIWCGTAVSSTVQLMPVLKLVNRLRPAHERGAEGILKMSRIKATSSRVALSVGIAYAVLTLVWPPVPGARLGATIGLVSLVVIFAIGYWRAPDRDRY